MTNREVGDGICIWLPCLRIIVQRSLQLVPPVLVDTFRKQPAIFKSCIAALAIEWNNSMGGVTNNNCIALVIVRLASDRE